MDLRGQQPVIAVVLALLVCLVEASMGAVLAVEPPPLSMDPARAATQPFIGWVGLADRHRADWERTSATLSDKQQDEAMRLGDKLFGGMFGGYWASLSGYDRAGGLHYSSRDRVREAHPDVGEPARHYLLWRLAALKAERIRRLLGHSCSHVPEFWDAFGRHALHGKHFGFLQDRAAHVIPQMMAEAALGDRLYDQGYVNPAGAHAMLAGARWGLARALGRFERGDADTGMSLVTDAVRSAQRARTYGMPARSVRAMLEDGFGDRLASNVPVVVYAGRPLTFRESLQDGIAHWKTRAERKPGFDLRSIAELYLGNRPEPPVERAGELEEHVVVTGKTAYLNLEGYLFRELELLVDDAAGLPLARRYAGLDLLCKLLFFAILEEDARRRDYEGARASYEAWLVSEHGIELSGDLLTRKMIGMGGRLFAIPGVTENLARTWRGSELVDRLALLDSAGASWKQQ